MTCVELFPFSVWSNELISSPENNFVKGSLFIIMFRYQIVSPLETQNT